MTITRHPGLILRGVKADTKPTSNILTNTLFIETDTNKTFIFSGSIWKDLTERPPYYYVAYIDPIDDKCKVLNTVDGTVDFTATVTNSHGTDSDSLAPIKAAIDASGTEEITTRGRDLYITAGEYHHKNTGAATFAGIDFPSDRRLRVHMAKKAVLYTRAGYTSYLFRFGKTGLNGDNTATNKVQSCELWGGQFAREGANTYTAIDIYSSGNEANGTYDLHIGGFYCGFAENVIKITRDENTAWINNNLFENISGDDNINHIVFVQDTSAGHITDDLTVLGNSHINFNRFSNLRFQTNGSVAYGVKDLAGRANIFDNCMFYDITPNGGVSGNITANAFNTQIIGGNVAESISTDPSLELGVNTMIQDDFNLIRNPGPLDWWGYYRKGATDDRYYAAGYISGNPGTASIASGTLKAFPFPVQRRTKFDTIAIRVTTGQASSTARFGIYADNGSCYPGKLIFQTAGAKATATSGQTVTETITSNLQWFNPGLYWLALEQDGTVATLVGFANTIASSILGFDNTMAIAGIGNGWSVAHTFGSLPNPFTGSAVINNTSVPGIFMRAVA